MSVLRGFGFVRNRLPAIVTLALLCSALVWSVAPARVLAAGNCSTDGNYFAGWWDSFSLTGHEPEGALAKLTVRTAASCQQGIGTGHNAGYSGWVMIQGNGQPSKYAQVGFVFNGAVMSCRNAFSQWNNGSGLHQATGPCQSTGSVHTTEVQYNGGFEYLWFDGSLYDTMPLCICSWARPLTVDYEGEDGNINGDVPGLSGSKTDWSNMEIQYYTDDTWHDTCNNIHLYTYLSNPPGRFAADAPACDHVRSWTATP